MWWPLLRSLVTPLVPQPNRMGPWLTVLLCGVLLLTALDTWTRYNERQTEKLRMAQLRAMVIDSVFRAQEAIVRRQREQKDSTLTTQYQRQAEQAHQQQTQNETVKSRYEANRVVLPAY